MVNGVIASVQQCPECFVRIAIGWNERLDFHVQKFEMRSGIFEDVDELIDCGFDCGALTRVRNGDS
jgi:hypothetical protein